jgi:hypothetical protein
MPAGIGTTGGFANFLSKDFTKIYYDELARATNEHKSFIKFGTADGNYIKKGDSSPLGGLVDRADGETLSYDIIKQGNSKTVYFTNIALGVLLTRNLYDDDRTGILKRIPAELAKSAAYTKELKAWDLLNSGFVTTYRSGLDSLALFSTSHTMLDYGTAQGNTPSSAGALSETTLQAALDHFDSLYNHKGIPTPIVPKKLVIPVALRPTAERLLQSTLRPGYADNDVNVLKGKLEIVVSHYLTSTTAWFVLADEHDLNMIWRKPISVSSEDDFDTDGAKFKVTGRLTCDFWNFFGTYGNAGA